MECTANDVLAAKLKELPRGLQDPLIKVQDRGHIQLNLPALLEQHISTGINDDTATDADKDKLPEQQQLEQLRKPSHEVVLQVIGTIDWQKLQVAALDLSGWDLQLKGWEQLLKGMGQADAMRKLVLSNSNIAAKPGEQQQLTAEAEKSSMQHVTCMDCLQLATVQDDCTASQLALIIAPRRRA